MNGSIEKSVDCDNDNDEHNSGIDCFIVFCEPIGKVDVEIILCRVGISPG